MIEGVVDRRRIVGQLRQYRLPDQGRFSRNRQRQRQHAATVSQLEVRPCHLFLDVGCYCVGCPHLTRQRGELMMHYWAASFLWQIFCRLAPLGGPATGATRSQRSPHAPIDQLVPGASRGGAILVAYDGWDQPVCSRVGTDTRTGAETDRLCRARDQRREEARDRPSGRIG